MLAKLNISRFYQLLGLLLVCETDSLSGRLEKCLKFWSLIIFSLNLGVTVISFYFADQIFYSDDVVGKFNDFLKYLTLSGTLYITLIESFGKMGYIKKFHERFKWMESKCMKIDVNLRPVLDKFKYKLNGKVVPILLLCMSYIIYEVGIFQSPLRLKRYAYISTVPAFICRCRHLQLAYYVVHVNAGVKVLNEKLDLIVKQSKEMNKNGTKIDFKEEKFLCDTLQRVKIIYGEIWMMTHDINEYFGWSTCFNFAQNFVQVTCDMYWIYMTIALTRITEFNRINFIRKFFYQYFTKAKT